MVSPFNVYRSTMCVCSVVKWPRPSSQVFPFRPATSTTKVSPSQLAIESPIKDGSGSSCLPPKGMRRQAANVNNKFFTNCSYPLFDGRIERSYGEKRKLVLLKMIRRQRGKLAVGAQV